jgi:hypothetical protein
VANRTDAPLDDLSVWVSAQTTGLASLAPELPSAAGAAVAHSMELLSDVSARADRLQVSLTCDSGPAVGRADALGPVPAPCVPAAADEPAPQSGTVDPGTGATTVLPSTSAAPTTPSVGGTESGGTQSGGGVGTAPGGGTVPGGTVPTTPPTLTLPQVPGLPSASPPSTPLKVPSGSLPLNACLPPLATVGDC